MAILCQKLENGHFVQKKLENCKKYIFFYKNCILGSFGKKAIFEEKKGYFFCLKLENCHFVPKMGKFQKYPFLGSSGAKMGKWPFLKGKKGIFCQKLENSHFVPKLGKWKKYTFFSFFFGSFWAKNWKMAIFEENEEK